MSSVLATAADPPLYFVCYAREQKDIVEKVEAKLGARRLRGELELWRDERNLDAWDKFTDVILAALTRAAGAIVVVSDMWQNSNYIQDKEWPTIEQRRQNDSWFKIFALAFEGLEDDNPLRERNFVNNVDDELLVDAPAALRDRVLTNLSNKIGEHARSLRQSSTDTSEPSAPPSALRLLVPAEGLEATPPDRKTGVLDGVPQLPEHYVEPNGLDALAAQVATGNLTAISGLQGEGGTGKSVLAAAVAHRTAHLFPDGVYWVTVGERATSEDVRRLQARLLRRLGGNADRPPRHPAEGKEMLEAALAGRAALIIVDDVWHPWHSRAFDVAEVGERVRVLFTTRVPEALPGGSATMRIARLEPAEAEDFLHRLFPGGVPLAPEELAAVLDAAGGLRLALAVLAATAKVEGSWNPVLSRLDGLAVRFGHGDDASSAQKALFVALDTLEPDEGNLALMLGAFSADVSIPIGLLAELWNIPLPQANQLADTLASRDLVAWDEDKLILHDHVHDFLVLQGTSPTSDVHLRLWELADEKRRRGWSALADEAPYLWDRLAWHACRAGLNHATLWAFVSDLEWLAERIRRQGASAAEQDVGRVCDFTALTDEAPLSQLRRVLRHGGLFDAASVGAGLRVSLMAWADVVGLEHRAQRRIYGGSLPVPSPALAQTIRGHSSESWGVSFSRDGRRLTTCSEDSTARIWDIRTGQPLLTLTGHSKQVWRLALSRDDRRLATAGADRTARVWDTTNGALVRTLPKHEGEVWGVALSSDGQRLATSSEGGTARIWTIETNDSPLILDNDRIPLWDIDFSPDGGRVATAGGDGTVSVWDSGDGKRLLTLTGHRGAVRAIAFGPDGRHLLTGGDDSTARLWDIGTERSARTLVGHSNAVWAVNFTDDGGRVVTGSDDGTARIWDAHSGEQLLTLAGHTSSVHGVAFSADGRRLGSVGGDGTARIWDTATDKGGGVPPGLASKVHDIALSVDNTRVLVAVGDRTAQVWNTATSQPVLTLTGHDGPLWGVAWSPDERLIASSSEDRTARVWDASNGKCLRTLKGHKSQVWDVKFSHDGRSLATVSEDKTARIWDTKTWKRPLILRGHSGRVWEVAFSSDDRRLATGGDDGTARIWDIVGDEGPLILPGHGGSVWDIAFSADDRWLATASEDCNARIWDARTGKIIHTLTGHTGQVWGITFNSDDRYLATASGDGTARIWNCDTGECLLTLAVACSGPVSWRGDLLAMAAGTHWAVIELGDIDG